MEMLERDVVLTGLDEDGKETLDLPVTRLGLIEDSAPVKSAPAAGDYIPLADSADGGKMKKTQVSALAQNLAMPDGSTIQTAVAALQTGLGKAAQALAGLAYYQVFEPSDWAGNTLRIPKAKHGMEPWEAGWMPPITHTLRQRIGRTALEYDEATAAPVAGLLIAVMQAALAANAETAGTYPTAEDGHVTLTWAQVQYALLESTSYEDEDEGGTVWTAALLGPAEAAAKAEAWGFDWQERDNGVEPTVTLDEILTAAYLPALGGVSTAFEAMVTAQALAGLRFRRPVAGTGYAAKYDLDGCMTQTWGSLGCRVHWDPGTTDLVVEGPGPFAGDLLVLGSADTSTPAPAQPTPAPAGDG